MRRMQPVCVYVCVMQSASSPASLWVVFLLSLSLSLSFSVHHHLQTFSSLSPIPRGRRRLPSVRPLALQRSGGRRLLTSLELEKTKRDGG